MSSAVTSLAPSDSLSHSPIDQYLNVKLLQIYLRYIFAVLLFVNPCVVGTSFVERKKKKGHKTKGIFYTSIFC